MDFQSRINQFRQGLSDQQDNFDRLASNAAQFGRTVLPDKVAKHYQYVEQVGGLTTGSFAAAHGGTKLYQRVKRIQAQKQAKQNNIEDPSQPQRQRARNVESDASQQEQRRTVEETEDKPQGPQNPGEVEVAADAEGRAKGGKLARSAEQAEGPEDEGVTGTAIKEGEQGTQLFTPEGLDEARAGPKPSTIDPRDFTQEAPDAPSVPQGKVVGDEDNLRIGPDTAPTASADDAPLRPAPNTAEVRGGAGDAEESVISARKAVSANIEDAGGEASEMISKAGNVASQVGDLVSGGADAAKEVAGRVAGQVAEKVGGEALANVAADAVPILGEAVGLGTLIYGIVKAHKHEENAPGPQLTKANPEAQEQTGGFEADALKSLNVAPSVV